MTGGGTVFPGSTEEKAKLRGDQGRLSKTRDVGSES